MSNIGNIPQIGSSPLARTIFKAATPMQILFPLFLLAGFIGAVFLCTARPNPDRKPSAEITRLVVFTFLPPYSWFYTWNRLLAARWPDRPALRATISAFLTAIGFIYFTAFMGSGAKYSTHSFIFHLKLGIIWFGVPGGYWIDAFRKGRR